MSTANNLSSTDVASTQTPMVFSSNDGDQCACQPETVGVCDSYGHDSDMCEQLKEYDACNKQFGIDDCAVPANPPIPQPVSPPQDVVIQPDPTQDCQCNDGTQFICGQAVDNPDLCTDAKHQDPCVLRGVDDCTLPSDQNSPAVNDQPPVNDSVDGGVQGNSPVDDRPAAPMDLDAGAVAPDTGAPDTTAQDTRSDSTATDQTTQTTLDCEFDTDADIAPPASDDFNCCTSSDFSDDM